ncbi:MAG: hypothetical protein IJU04_03110 [Ruminococcus sp.]|nr:hypothetical protein [Ruminococcus sp.]
MKNKLIKLIDLKSIITILMTLVFCVMSMLQVISSQQFMTVFVTVIAFYFGTQQKKNPAEQDKLKQERDNFEL